VSSQVFYFFLKLSFFACAHRLNEEYLERLKQDIALLEKRVEEYCRRIRGGKMGLLHKIGYVLEVAAFCSLIILKVWKAVEHPGFVVTVLLMVSSMYCLARAELPR
jgi:hypothetical protein